MTIALGERGARGVVLDIEGTTTPVAFVYDVLFPYARVRLREYLAENRESEELRDVFRGLRAERLAEVVGGAAPPEIDATSGDEALGSVATYVEWLMDRDRKSPGLKLLQGKIWERGYHDGTLRGQVFPDVPGALERWRAAGITVAIYSSGNVLAQRLLFATTTFGDLTPLIDHFFDTGVGPKRSADSYHRIASQVHRENPELLFISDVSAELEAARSAGLQTLLCIRPGNDAEVTSSQDVILTFDEIVA